MQQALESLPGVANVEIDVDQQTATCAVNPEEFDTDQAISLLADTGFPDSLRIDGDVAPVSEESDGIE